ncbi:uncharacterized protein LOC107405495 [Ziziphus jujuba]|uniref:Uncharacterized protein LOC107405495 n=1 Tax=Ziziphus jujuba TaxID=326968 RepID=A0A6P3YV59_ZIZJJ|nr:uncharacterized protein LOC107405495 [Ziziphus jujuba]
MVTVTIAVANLWKGGAAFGHSLPHVRNFQIPTFIYKNAKQQQHPRIRIWISSPTLPTLFSTSASTRSSSFCTHVSASDAAAAAVAGDEQAQIMDAANLLDIRVGRILKAWRHAEADSLYVEEVDVGEPEPRLICSGLVNYIPLHHLQDAKVVVLANLKPRNMRGVKSCGMLMAASDPSHENVEPLVPPEGSFPGERIWFGSEHDKENLPPPASPNQIQKKKIWELVQPHLKTDDCCLAVLGEHVMRTSAGVVLCKSLKNGNIS